MADRHPALARLDVLAGRWTVQPAVRGVAPALTEATWVEGGTFLRQITDRDPIPDDVPDAWRGFAPFPTVTMIGMDESAQEFTVLYADARGVHRVYQMTLVGREWTMSRRAPGMNQRFAGIISEDGDRIDGRWEASEDGEAWNLDFELTYTRQR
jgi:hypothetical protein